MPLFSSERTQPPSTFFHALQNGGLVNVTAVENSATTPVAGPNTNPVSFQIRLTSLLGLTTPEVAAVSLRWPTEELEPDDATEDISSSWQLIRFELDREFVPCRFQVKGYWGRVEDNLERLTQPPRSIDLKILDDAGTGYVPIFQGFIEENRETPHGEAGLFYQLDGWDLTKRAYDRQVGMLQAANSMSWFDFFEVVLGSAGFPPSKVDINDIKALIENGSMPQDFLTLVEDQRPAQVLRHFRELFSGYLVTRLDYDTVKLYPELPWDGSEPAIVLTDATELLGGLTHYQRMRLPQRILKVRSKPEFATLGAGAHRLVVLGSSGTGDGHRHGVIIQGDPRAWTDAGFDDFEGKKEIRVVSPPRLTASSAGAVELAARALHRREGSPKRWLRLETEYHYSLRPDQLVRYVMASTNGPIDMGMWRVDHISAEISHDSNRLDSESWRCSCDLIRESP